MCYSIMETTNKRKIKAIKKFLNFIFSKEIKDEWIKKGRMPTLKAFEKENNNYYQENFFIHTYILLSNKDKTKKNGHILYHIFEINKRIHKTKFTAKTDGESVQGSRFNVQRSTLMSLKE